MLERRLARLVSLALIALVLFDFPVLAVVERVRVDGVPILPFYLFAVWGAVIALAAWLIERPGEE